MSATQWAVQYDQITTDMDAASSLTPGSVPQKMDSDLFGILKPTTVGLLLYGRTTTWHTFCRIFYLVFNVTAALVALGTRPPHNRNNNG